MSDRKPKIDLSDDDFGAVINCAIRYCLGRRTYMPGLVCGYVKPLLPYLNDRTLCCMERDIRTAPSYGDACDVATWTMMHDTVAAAMLSRSLERWN